MVMQRSSYLMQHGFFINIRAKCVLHQGESVAEQSVVISRVAMHMRSCLTSKLMPL
jgi:hypothetical protein